MSDNLLLRTVQYSLIVACMCCTPTAWSDDAGARRKDVVTTVGFPRDWKTDAEVVNVNGTLQNANRKRGRFQAVSPRISLKGDFALQCEHEISGVGRLEIWLAATRRQLPPIVVGIGRVEFGGVREAIVPKGKKRTLRLTRQGTSALVTVPGMKDIRLEVGREFSRAEISQIRLVFQAGKNSHVKVFKMAARTLPAGNSDS